MKITKYVVTATTTIALAASMACVIPAAAQAAPAARADTAASATASSTFAPMASSTTKATVKANEKRELLFLLNKKKVKPSKVSWSTSNAKVATVKKGIMTTKKEGKVTITAKYKGHTVYYKITVKGDALFDVAIKDIKRSFKSDGELVTENGVQIYRFSGSDSGTTLNSDYVESKNLLILSVATSLPNNPNTYGVAFSLSTKYNKNCTVTSYKNGVKVASITMKKTALKAGTTYKLSSDIYDNEIFHAMQAVAIKGLIEQDAGVLTYMKALGFTNINK